jgi:hypothetical protein
MQWFMKSCRAWLLAVIGVSGLAGCGPSSQSNALPAQSAGSPGTIEAVPDGGSLPSSPASRKGVLVPSDTGMGASDSSGMKTNTGTNGPAVGPTLGNPSGGN